MTLMKMKKKMTMQTTMNDEWGSDYLLVKDVQDNDIIKVEELIGFTESFGKKKYSLKVSHNGSLKILNLNRFQYKMMMPIRAGGGYQVTKVSVNGGTALNFKAL